MTKKTMDEDDGTTRMFVQKKGKIIYEYSMCSVCIDVYLLCASRDPERRWWSTQQTTPFRIRISLVRYTRTTREMLLYFLFFFDISYDVYDVVYKCIPRTSTKWTRTISKTQTCACRILTRNAWQMHRTFRCNTHEHTLLIYLIHCSTESTERLCLCVRLWWRVQWIEWTSRTIKTRVSVIQVAEKYKRSSPLPSHLQLNYTKHKQQQHTIPACERDGDRERI